MTGRILAFFAALVPLSLLSQLKWEEQVWDFGTIREAEGAVEHVFRYRNDSGSPVTIHRVAATCGCTTVIHSDRPLNPGGTDSLTVCYDPANRPGAFDKQIAVYAGDSSYRLEIRGKAIASEATLANRFPHGAWDVRLSATLLPVGEVMQGMRRSAYLFGYNAGNDTLPIRFRNVPDNLQLSASAERVAPHDVFSVSAVFHAGQETDFGFHEHETLLLAGERDTFALRISASVVADPTQIKASDLADAPQAAVSTNRLNFGSVSGTKQAVQTLNVKNNGKRTLEILQAASMHEAITAKGCPLRIEPGGSGKINVSADPGKITETVINTEIILLTNDPANRGIHVRVVGTKQQ